jgi:hypothetical protein
MYMAMKTNLKYLYSCRSRFRDKDEVKPSPAGLSSLPASSFWIASLRDLSAAFVLASRFSYYAWALHSEASL